MKLQAVGSLFFLVAMGVVSQKTDPADGALVCPECELDGIPVCGTDSMTYNSECGVVAKNCSATVFAITIAVQYTDACKCTMVCPTGVNGPVCTFDGVMYTQKREPVQARPGELPQRRRR